MLQKGLTPMRTLKWQAGTNLCRFDRWDDLASELSEHIRLLAQKVGRYVVVERTNPTRYVQFASLKDGSIVGEAVSNYSLMGHEHFTTAMGKHMVQLGWERPGRPELERKNFRRQWAPPVSIHDVVALAIRTLRETFGIATPLGLGIRRSEFAAPPSTPSTVSLTMRVETGAWVRPSQNPALRLGSGLIVHSAISGREYRVGPALGAGGFGAAYQVEQVSGRDRLPGKLALKVSAEPRGWYREAYFGDLLSEASGIVRMHEAFAWVPRGTDGRPLYCLISELVEGGDLTHYLKKHSEAWPEWKARREIIRLLRAVRLVHASGAVHRDITPNNVFVAADRVLKLGDFGIASHRIGGRDVRADSFNGWFAPPSIKSGKDGLWRQADDVYHLGQLFALLLHGGGKSRLTASDAKKLSCTPEAKALIQRCIGERRKRFADAGEMLVALEKEGPKAEKRTVVRSLKGKRVVFTGPLTIPRASAQRLVKKAGGIVENQVSHRTDVVVLGEQSPHWKAEKKGQKLLDLDHERELGHEIAMITERRFRMLVGKARQGD
jgi:hypothetical protein